MALSTEGVFPWHTSYHYLQPEASAEEIDVNHFSHNENLPSEPESILLDNLESAATHVQPSFMKPPSNTFQVTTQRKRSNERNEGNFHWGDLKKGGSNGADSRQDDGVVLLVAIFNLLAVVVYAAQEFLAGNSKGKDKRVVLWQVQKVLDELVLRVHSSQTAANLLSRALKTSSRSTSGRNIDNNSLSSILYDALQETDPLKLRSWLDDAKNKLIVELSTIPVSDLGPRIDPRIYRPLQNLYYKVTETTRKGRSFSSSLLQEASTVARTVSQVSFKDVQSILMVVSKLGRLQRQYDVLPMLKMILPLAFPASILEPEQQFFPKPETEVVRQRRRLALYPPYRVMRKLRQRQNSRSLRLSDKIKSKQLQVDNNEQQLGSSGTIMERRGTVENLEYDDLSGNWADKWFSLLTQVSPIALDFTNLYSHSRTQPNCLRALLCKSNKYWKMRGTLHAAITPFLSVITSWALEESSPHSLGDSLIAVRAGWMEKDCQSIYPECQGGAKLKSPPTFDLSPSPSRPQNQVYASSSNFISKSGEVFTTDENDKLIQTAEPSSKMDHQIQHISSSPNNLNAQIYHASVPSPTLINQNNEDDLPAIFEMETPQEDEESQSNNVLFYNPHPNYSEDDESGNSDSPDQNLIFVNGQKDNDKTENIHPQLITQVYQNSHQHPQHLQRNDISLNHQKTKQKLVGSESSVPLPTNVDIEEHPNDHERNVLGIGSDSHDKGFQKKYYERYDRPETDGEMDYLMSSGSVSGMALQDRLVERRKMLVPEGKEGSSLNRKEDSDGAQIPINNTSPRNKFENPHDLKRDSHHEVMHKNNQHPMPPWAKEGAAAAFLSQPSYSNYIVSQKPAFLKPPPKPPAPYKPKNREPVSYPVISPSGFPKYKYGVRRGLPAGNVGGNGLLESIDNELFSSSQKYKKKQVLQPQSLALTSDKNTPSVSIPISIKNMKLKKNPALKPTAMASKPVPSKPTKLAPSKPTKLAPSNSPKLAQSKPLIPSPSKPSAPSSAESKEVAQFGPADAITDAHRNEILHQYVRDRHIRDVSRWIT